jgi:meiosis induction protein kinase IME2/SME1
MYHHPPPPNASGFIQEERRSRALASSVWESSNGHPSAAVNTDYNMDVSPASDEYLGGPMDIHGSPIAQEFPARPHILEPMHDAANGINGHDDIQSQPNKLGKLGSLSFGKKHSKWGLGGMFSSDKSHQNGHLPPAEDMPIASTSTPSLKRSQSTSSSRSLREPSPVREPLRIDVKKNKKEAERMQREAEKQRRALAEKMHREQARAVMQKRNQIVHKNPGMAIEWNGRLEWDEANSKGKEAASGPVRQNQAAEAAATTINAAAGRFGSQSEVSSGGDWRRDTERMAKARRREFDDDHSMSSSDVHSIGRMSVISFASVDSDPGPSTLSRIRNRPSLLGMSSISRMTSSSSLHTSLDEFTHEFTDSARTSNSFSLDAHDLRSQASFDRGAPMTGSISPPPMQTLSLSPSHSPSSTSPWLKQDARLPYLPHSPLHPRTSPMNGNTFEFSGQLLNRSHSPYGHPPSPGGGAPKSAINPIFQVVCLL